MTSKERPFRFGIQAWAAPDRQSWADFARRAEDLGFSTLVMPDHLEHDFAPIPALVAAADATTELRVGPLVLAADFRNPAFLAKELATLDVLSDGRLEVGIGAGWNRSDYEQSSMEFDPASTRIARLAEVIAILKGAWSGEPFDLAGEHFQIAGLRGIPKPAQSPHPPLLIGGGGKTVLSLAARHADIVGINPTLPAGHVDDAAPSRSTSTATDAKIRWVREAAGDRIDDIELSMLVGAGLVGIDLEAIIAEHAPLLGLTPDEILDLPHAWIGTIDEICEKLHQRRERWGISYWILENESDLFLQGHAIDIMAPVVQRLAGT